jgi:hypothetical protein
MPCDRPPLLRRAVSLLPASNGEDKRCGVSLGRQELACRLSLAAREMKDKPGVLWSRLFDSAFGRIVAEIRLEKQLLQNLCMLTLLWSAHGRRRGIPADHVHMHVAVSPHMNDIMNAKIHVGCWTKHCWRICSLLMARLYAEHQRATAGLQVFN